MTIADLAGRVRANVKKVIQHEHQAVRSAGEHFEDSPPPVFAGEGREQVPVP